MFDVPGNKCLEIDAEFKRRCPDGGDTLDDASYFNSEAGIKATELARLIREKPNYESYRNGHLALLHQVDFEHVIFG